MDPSIQNRPNIPAAATPSGPGVGATNFARGLGGTQGSTTQKLGQTLESAAIHTPAVGANLATNAVLGGLMLAAAFSPLSMLVLPAMLGRTALRGVIPMPALTGAIAGMSLMGAFRPINPAYTIGSAVAIGALASSMQGLGSSAASLKLPPKIT